MTDPLADILKAGALGWWVIKGLNCSISLEPRPAYCNRGNFLAKLDADPVVGINNADGWPRYYFDRDRAMTEIEAWLRKRGQWIDSRWTYERESEGGVVVADQRAKEEWERLVAKRTRPPPGISWLPEHMP